MKFNITQPDDANTLRNVEVHDQVAKSKSYWVTHGKTTNQQHLEAIFPLRKTALRIWAAGRYSSPNRCRPLFGTIWRGDANLHPNANENSMAGRTILSDSFIQKSTSCCSFGRAVNEGFATSVANLIAHSGEHYCTDRHTHAELASRNNFDSRSFIADRYTGPLLSLNVSLNNMSDPSVHRMAEILNYWTFKCPGQPFNFAFKEVGLNK